VLRSPPKFKQALETLAHHEVAFVVVGGVAAVLAGAPISTFDLDVVHARDPANVDRLLDALTELDARYRDPGGRIRRPTADALAGPGHHLLMTTCGPVDVLGRIGAGQDHSDLVPDSVALQVGDCIVRVLGLPALIRTKAEAGRDKDRAVLAILRHTLEQAQKG